MPADLVNPKRLTKAVAETRRFHIDFEGMDEIIGGDPLTGTPTVTATPSGLTLTNPSIDTNPDSGAATRVGITIAAGTVETAYTVRMTCSTEAGFVLSRCFILDVKDV